MPDQIINQAYLLASICTDNSNLVLYKEISSFMTLCEENSQATHIIFLGTTLLQRAIDQDTYLLYIKPKHKPANDNKKAYSARTLCHNTLLPAMINLDIPLPTSGREPLNNQPYFRMNYLGDQTPFSSLEIKNSLIALVYTIQSLSQDNAISALAAFFKCRVERQVHVAPLTINGLDINAVLAELSAFTKANSEGGKRAQAISSGIYDYFLGAENILSSGINDPSRHYPGDICVLDPATKQPIMLVEVRDKKVTKEDIIIFMNKVNSQKITKCNVIALSDNQEKFSNDFFVECYNRGGIVHVYYSYWDLFFELFRQPIDTKEIDCTKLKSLINNRLKNIGSNTLI